MKLAFSLVLSLAIIPTVGFAKTKNAYTQCGIGALIFQKTGWAAAISNIIWDLGTTGSTSSSSTPSQCAGKGAAVGKLIHENYARIEEETAAGQGEHLQAILNLLDCDRSIHSALISDVRSDFYNDVRRPEFSGKSKLEKTEAFFNNIMEKAVQKYPSFCSAG
jgi:hypothetical protein